MQRVWRTVTGFYHVCARGVGKQLIFEGDEDRWEFLELMRECCREAGVTVIAWCLMGNHVHLVLADYEDAMSAAMHRLLLTYARRFNKRTGRTGHLFQNRFDRRSLDTDRYLMAAIRYVHANPQEAGIALIVDIQRCHALAGGDPLAGKIKQRGGRGDQRLLQVHSAQVFSHARNAGCMHKNASFQEQSYCITSIFPAQGC